MSTTETLRFEYTPEIWPDSPPRQHWFSGRYKITFYDGYETDDIIHKPCYYAYFKPNGWKNWGMGCEAGNPRYATLAQAQDACARHAEIGDYTYRETFRKPF